jgi:phosphopantetheinyl transferase (holo-ACP synthase)
MRFFVKKYLGPRPVSLAQDYVRLEKIKSELEEQRPQIYEQILALQEGELYGKSDPEVLQAAQVSLLDTDQKTQAAGRAMTRLSEEIPKALTADIDNQMRGIQKLKRELADRQAAAMRRVNLAQEVLSFLQGTDLAEIPSIRDTLQELGKEIGKIEGDPEALDFQDLNQMVHFLDEIWAEPEKKAVKSPVDWQAGDLNRANTKKAHLLAFQSLLIAAARQDMGSESN